MNRKEMRKQKKQHKRRRFLLIFLSIFLILVGIGGYFLLQTYNAASNTYDDLGREKSDKRDKVVTIKNDDPVSLLLMGVEDYSSGGKGGRSDTLMVLTFNPKAETLKMLSIPRDTLVEIPGRESKDKINHSFSFGGKELTIETVENFLNIPIDYYATVNFEGFKTIVDTVGGITVDVPFNFQQNSDDRVAEKLQFYEGEMHLDGRYALAYARMRLEDPTGDIGRNERQKEVVKAVINELTSISTITKIDDLAETIGENVETNMRVSEGISFFTKYKNFSISNIDQLKLEGASQYIDNISYYIYEESSLDSVKQELSSHLELARSNSTLSAESDLDKENPAIN